MLDEVWIPFTTAGFTCWVPGPVTVRPRSDRGRSGRFPFAGPATFVTSDNPGGRVAPEGENRSRRAELVRWLDAAGLAWHPAVGGDPEGAHLEPGAVVLGLDLASAVGLGARFEQAAVYVWEPTALHLVACIGDRYDILGYQATPGSRHPPPSLANRRNPRPWRTRHAVLRDGHPENGDGDLRH